MTGKELSNKIKQLNYSNAHVASNMGITEQALNSKLKTSDAKFSLIKDLAFATNTSVYEWINEASPLLENDNTDYKQKYLNLLEEYKAISDQLTACLQKRSDTQK